MTAKATGMKKYRCYVIFDAGASVVVEAENEEEAADLAMEQASHEEVEIADPIRVSEVLLEE